MARRKRKNGSFIAYFFSAIVLLIIVLLYFLGVIKIDLTSPGKMLTGQNNIVVTGEKSNSKVQNNEYYANSTIHFKGIIYKIPYNLKVGVGFKLKQDNKEIFVKSDKYVLDDFENQYIEGTGEIVGFYADNTPVINILEIKQTNENETGENQESKITNQFISYSGLKIDLEDTDYSILFSGDSLYIVDYFSGSMYSGENFTGNKYLKISPFKCRNTGYVYNCNQLLQQAKTLKFKKIVSDNGVTYYSLPETDDYFVANTEYGYYIRSLSGNLLNFINFMSLEDTKSKKLSIIKDTCKNDKIKLKDILKITSTGDNYEVIGFDTNGNKILCKLNLRFYNGTYIGKLDNIKYYNQDIQIRSDKIDESKYLKYKSRAYGYTLYMPKSVKYKSNIVNEDFSISGLKCLQRVDIANWKNGSLENPDVQVYYCKTRLDKETIDKLLSNKDFNYTIYTEGNKIFIIKYNIGKGQDIVSNIRIY